MLIQLLTIIAFGFVGFLVGRVIKPSRPVLLNVSLVVLLIILANSHGFGFSGIGEYHMYHNDILQGIIGGLLIQRVTQKVTPSA